MSPKRRSSPLRVRPQPAPKIGKSERTRAAILNSALDFIWSHPFRDMTVDSVMVPTGVTRSAFYQHFTNLHELMETLLNVSQKDIFEACAPWFTKNGDPVVLMRETMAGLVRVTYRSGPVFRAVADAAATDKRFEGEWRTFLGGFDDAVAARVEGDQEQGLIPRFDVRPVAVALNRLDAYTIIDAFGQRPRKQPHPVREALARIWVSTLYGAKWLGEESSDLIRT